MNLVEEKYDDTIYFDPILVISKLAQLSIYPSGKCIYIVKDKIKIIDIPDDTIKHDFLDIITTFEYLWDPILTYIDWYKIKLKDKYKDDYKIITTRAIHGIQKLRELAGSRMIIENILSKIIYLLAECCGEDITGIIINKRSPYIGGIFIDLLSIPELDNSMESKLKYNESKKDIKRIDIQPFIMLLNQYDSKITESEEELYTIRQNIEEWIQKHLESK